MNRLVVHGSIDIEALDVDPSNNATVLAVGIVAFNAREEIDAAEWILDPIWSPGTRSKSTYDWWMDQELDVRNAMFGGHILPWKFCPMFSSFVGLNGIELLWGFPARYDIGHLRALFKAMECPFPTLFNKERDMSTLVDLAEEIGLGEELRAIRDLNPNPHDALSDARNQAKRLQRIFQYFKAYGA